MIGAYEQSVALFSVVNGSVVGGGVHHLLQYLPIETRQLNFQNGIYVHMNEMHVYVPPFQETEKQSKETEKWSKES